MKHRPTGRVATTAAIALATVLVLPVAVGGADRAFRGRNGSIAFASKRGDGAWELWAVHARGGTARQLTAHSPLAFGTPAWSPDGRTIAFGAVGGTTFLVDVEGRRARELAPSGSAFLDGVSWAPGSKQLVYSVTDKKLGRTDVWIADASGTHRRRLTSGGTDFGPAWSPDGRTIAFAHGWPAPSIYLIGNDGTHLRRLDAGQDPVWSPDGTMIAFTRDESGKSVYVIGASGSNARSLGSGGSPAWSPDSQRLVAVTAAGTGVSKLFVLAADGSSRRMLQSDCYTDSAVWAPARTITVVAGCPNGNKFAGGLQSVDPVSGDRRWLASVPTNRDDDFPRSPSWSTDGKRLAFLRSGVLKIMNADGSALHDLLDRPAGNDTRPAWSPDGRRLALNATTLNPLRGAPALIASPVRNPSWSPDGIHLVGNRGDSDQDVLIADLKTGALKQIYHDDGAGQPTLSDAAWSPDGRSIVFGTDNGLTRYDVKRGHGDWNFAPAIRGVAGTSGQNPAWSPDGKRLAFDTRCDPSNPSRRCSVFVSAPDGAHARRIAANAAEPAWSPDGRQISFVRVLGQENSEIYVMSADGSHQHRLTFNKGPDLDPDWQSVH